MRKGRFIRPFLHVKNYTENYDYLGYGMNCKIRVTPVVGRETVSPTDMIKSCQKKYRLGIKTINLCDTSMSNRSCPSGLTNSDIL